MNCKQGDMAVVIKSMAGNEGKIVTCLKFVGKDLIGVRANADDFWLVDKQMNCINNGGGPGTMTAPYARDHCLRPLRPSDKVDEMLLIAGLPNKVKEKA
jgi:hypothetical protein